MTRANEATSTKASRKRMGAHYTPPLLARFVAEKIVARLDVTWTRPIRFLDPACGDGQLLVAAIEATLRAGARNWEAVGVEADAHALGEARRRLEHGDHGSIRLIPGDFLDLATAFQAQRQLWSAQPSPSGLGNQFDAVIANPPYVRTQVLGAAESQRIASRFGLSGRVDLYHAFIRAMADALRNEGILGIITSNRFMTTLAGKAVRRFLADKLEVLEIIDLGDTKLFEAAVLPAVLIARRRGSTKPSCSYLVPFTRVYSHSRMTQGAENCAGIRGSVVEAIDAGDKGLVKVPAGTFAITRGHFSVAPGTDGIWGLVSCEEEEVLKRIRERSDRTIAEVAFVRVGIKTTADEVFIRDNWAALPPGKRPEDELLRPILCHEDARRWAIPARYVPATRVLYPHLVVGGRKRVVDLNTYPRGRAYLEDFRSRLEARRYVSDAGRRWYEIWVPQDPVAWGLPKIVFPDISPEPKFCLVHEDFVVNGDCYWMTLRPGVSEETLYLILGVANSTLMASFHDAAFNNKLYSGRRRYITQYVGKYPLPHADTPAARRIVSLAKELVGETRRGATPDDLRWIEGALDALVSRAFGFESDRGT